MKICPATEKKLVCSIHSWSCSAIPFSNVLLCTGLLLGVKLLLLSELKSIHIQQPDVFNYMTVVRSCIAAMLIAGVALGS